MTSQMDDDGRKNNQETLTSIVYVDLVSIMHPNCLERLKFLEQLSGGSGYSTSHKIDLKKYKWLR